MYMSRGRGAGGSGGAGSVAPRPEPHRCAPSATSQIQPMHSACPGTIHYYMALWTDPSVGEERI